MPPKPQLLDLPNELMEQILSLLCLESPADIIACRLVCRALNALVQHSVLVQYLMHVSLLGAYDPFAAGVAAPALPERMTELRAWDDAWSVVGDLLQHEPDVRIAPPDMDIDVDFESDDTSALPSRRFRHRYSFNPWFIVAAREGPHLRAGYSYLDVHECYRRTTAPGDGDASTQSNDDEFQWSRVEAPVRNAIVLALAPELDLAVAISCVVYRPLLSSLY
ncbi:hypothetical protein BGW80DRAFT_616971 [Lactifluus volemus]|nr:hypothetical protein BGW80DRAFT_616971 [Lactifluus volemus]